MSKEDSKGGSIFKVQKHSKGNASSKTWGVSNPGKCGNKYNNWGTKKGNSQGK